MNVSNLIPFLGGAVPGIAGGDFNIDPRAMIIGGIMPGLLNQGNGGVENLSPSIMPGMLNMNSSFTDNIPDFTQNMKQLAFMNFLKNQNQNLTNMLG